MALTEYGEFISQQPDRIRALLEMYEVKETAELFGEKNPGLYWRSSHHRSIEVFDELVKEGLATRQDINLDAAISSDGEMSEAAKEIARIFYPDGLIIFHPTEKGEEVIKETGINTAQGWLFTGNIYK